MFAANVLLIAAASAGANLSLRAAGSPRRRWLVIAAGFVVAALVIGDAFFLWVESHGDRCIGTCG